MSFFIAAGFIGHGHIASQHAREGGLGRLRTRLQLPQSLSFRALSPCGHSAGQKQTPIAVVLTEAEIEAARADCLRREGVEKQKQRMIRKASVGRGFRKGEGRLWTNAFVRERLSPFRKSASHFLRVILLYILLYHPTAEFRACGFCL